MKDYYLYYDNQETKESGSMFLSILGDEQVALDTFFTIIGNSVNPTTTLTLVES